MMNLKFKEEEILLYWIVNPYLHIKIENISFFQNHTRQRFLYLHHPSVQRTTCGRC
jgi:hypothetical protein